MSATVLIPNFTDAELLGIRRMLVGHYGRDVKIQVSCCEIRVADSDEELTLCPAVLWQEHGTNFLLMQIGYSVFRGQYFHIPKQQYIAGKGSYRNLQDCAAALLNACPTTHNE